MCWGTRIVHHRRDRESDRRSATSPPRSGMYRRNSGQHRGSTETARSRLVVLSSQTFVLFLQSLFNSFAWAWWWVVIPSPLRGKGSIPPEPQVWSRASRLDHRGGLSGHPCVSSRDPFLPAVRHDSGVQDTQATERPFFAGRGDSRCLPCRSGAVPIPDKARPKPLVDCETPVGRSWCSGVTGLFHHENDKARMCRT